MQTDGAPAPPLPCAADAVLSQAFRRSSLRSGGVQVSRTVWFRTAEGGRRMTTDVWQEARSA